MRPVGSPELLEGRRKKAIEMLKRHLQPVEVAKRLGVDRRSVRRWKSAFLKNGIGALKSRPAPGRTPRLCGEMKMKISKMLEKSPAHFGFKNDVWTYELVARAVKKEFGVEYHINYIGQLLRSMGWSLERLRAVERRPRLNKK